MDKNSNIEHILLIANDAEKIGYEIFKDRIDKNLWPIYLRTKLNKYLKKGINVIFYIAGDNQKSQSFVASAKISQTIDKDILEYDPNKKFAQVIYYLKFENINIFKKNVKIKEHLDNLSFIKTEKKRYFGLYLQGGISKIDQKSYNCIIKNSY